MSVLVTSRFSGTVRGHLGRRPIGTGPYRGHERWETEAELDIPLPPALPRSSPKKKEGREDAGEDATVAGDGSGAEMAPAAVLYELGVVGPTL